ncbi:MAG: Maf family protein [Cyanobacterium sp.]
MTKFILASASPARLKLLRMIGINPQVEVSNYDESLVDLLNPHNLVNTLAENKASMVAQNHNDGLILGCDSVLAVNGEIYGKPENEQDAINRWRNMRGNGGKLYTGHALLDLNNGQRVVRCGITEVYFANVDDDTIRAYVATGEPLKCAGSFALEGRGGFLIDKIVGCHSNVIGLSLPLLRQMLTELNYRVTDFW